MDLLKNPFQSRKLPVRAWLINPVNQSATEVDSLNLASLIDETVGNDAEAYKLDNSENVCWMSNTDTNSRYAYFWEGMCSPFDYKRYSMAIVESMGPDYWSLETISDYLRFYDKENVWGDV
jgi:hypothetical protein